MCIKKIPLQRIVEVVFILSCLIVYFDHKIKVEAFPVTDIAEYFARRDVCKYIVAIVPLNELTNVVINACISLTFNFKESKCLIHIFIYGQQGGIGGANYTNASILCTVLSHKARAQYCVNDHSIPLLTKFV